MSKGPRPVIARGLEGEDRMFIPARRFPRRAFAAAAMLAVAGAVTLAQEADRSGDAKARAGSGRSWARTATGAIEPVTVAHFVTPVHPEAITHPGGDAMGGSQLTKELTAATKPMADAPPTPAQDSVVGPNPIRPDSAIPQLPGIDVSNHQGPINWAAVAPHIDFVYVEATEGTYFRNADFAGQYNGSYQHGLVRGAYHFAIPNNSSGTTQADYFIAHGGGWSADGRTLPGVLDIEYNPYGPQCYGLTSKQMVEWIDDFVTEYASRTHAYPVIYSTNGWWTSCTAGSSTFTTLDPLWIANYSTGPGALPGKWGFYTFWQYSDKGSLPGDQDRFNGALDRVKVLAAHG